MKLTVFLFALFLTNSCSQNTPRKTEISLPPVAEAPSITNKTQVVPASVTSEADESEKRYIKQKSESFGIADLEKVQFSKEDLEVRLWSFSGLGMPMFKNLAVKQSVFVLRRTNGEWMAVILRDTVDPSKKERAEKRLETKLTEPKSGWENVWRQLVANEILTLPNGREVGDLGGCDISGITVETKNEGVYRLYKYNGTYHSYSKEEGIKPIREAYQMAEIKNVIANEFDVTEFRTKIPELEGYKFPELP